MYGSDSPPRSIPTPNGFNYMQRHSPVVIEQNVSYTRGGQGPQIKSEEQPGPRHNNQADPESDEDARFLRLAHEALVATSTESNLIVDPTIQDLLARLQYVSSPHGNPIKHSDSIRSNENGQLMIQSFYKEFPNLSNNIFTGDTDTNPSSKKSEGWNFLLDKTSESQSPDASDHASQDLPSRKFPCSGCSMSFRRSSDLKRHAKQHLSIPANICEQCGKGFARRDALKRHTGTMTCKRNADKKIYYSNLDFLKKK
ncbi:hypothetical protein JCM33374_g1321 [Metschnikowia sp. JCM 33374]|nr:hypothetical protein JCM33374_g1321 [Metschnikowia sp. JCM 33374]